MNELVLEKSRQIREYWDSQARAHGAGSAATAPDTYAKQLEIDAIGRFIRPGLIADVGCGNGFSTLAYARTPGVTLVGVDYSAEMIRVAAEALGAQPADVQHRTRFQQGDVRALPFADAVFDCVTTDRCLINLTTREEQAAAMREVHRVLKPGGTYLMCENTETGLSNLNALRAAAGLDAIAVRWHNLYLDESHVRAATAPLFQPLEVVRFAGFYYLASRILNATLAQARGEEPRYDADLNRVAAQYSAAIDCGDYAPVKLFVYRKTAGRGAGAP